ncbi:hypothetical protein NKH77_07405 [Streptomyces sp. M19]
MARSAGTRRTTDVRRHYRELIDALLAEGDREAARACAELAVAQGVWRHPEQRPSTTCPRWTRARCSTRRGSGSPTT